MRSSAQSISSNTNLSYAVKIVHATCCLAGSPSYLADVSAELRQCGVLRAIERHDTPLIFDWLVELLSFQGISDAVAANYIAKHGTATWAQIDEALSRKPLCEKLSGYWSFEDCNYNKSWRTCSQPTEIGQCPLPRHPLRNGRLNQTSYSLFLFMRDAAEGDFVSWIDRQIEAARTSRHDRLAACREALLEPLRQVYGVGDKVLAITLAPMLLASGKKRPLWFEVGADLVAVDTLVHNFLRRTGILTRFSAEHAYGPRCYGPGGCEAILRLIASHIDAQQFNPAYPANFPRFIQHSVWRYCAGGGLDVCNGNRIDDAERCEYAHCQLFSACDREPVRPKAR